MAAFDMTLEQARSIEKSMLAEAHRMSRLGTYGEPHAAEDYEGELRDLRALIPVLAALPEMQETARVDPYFYWALTEALAIDAFETEVPGLEEDGLDVDSIPWTALICRDLLDQLADERATSAADLLAWFTKWAERKERLVAARLAFYYPEEKTPVVVNETPDDAPRSGEVDRVSASEAAALLGPGWYAKRVLRLREAGELPAVRIGERWKFARTDVEAYATAQTGQPETGQSAPETGQAV